MSRVLASALLCGACSIAPSAPQPAPLPLADIPIEILHRLPTVEVRVAGERLKLFLDLGGYQAIALTPSELGRTRVRFGARSSRFRNSHGQVLESRQFVAEDVFLGSFPLGDLEGGESSFGDSVPPDRNGYIGMPILGRYLLVVDYPEKRIRLYESGDASALRSECGENTFPVALVNGVAVTAGSTQYGNHVFLWDTGSTDNVFRPSALPSDAAVGRRIDDGPAVVNIQGLKLGEYAVGAQEFRLIQFGAPHVDAVLGEGLFATRRVCLDIPQGEGAMR